MKNLSIEKPSVAEVKRCLDIWDYSDEYEKYRRQEESVVTLFKELYPKNTELKKVLIKVCVLNDFYSTNIRDVYTVALNIVRQDIDGKLTNAEVGIIDDIARVTINGKEWNFYSFATKYCSHHYPDKYPICDSLVSEVLIHFRNKDKFHGFKNNDLRNYSLFQDVIQKFIEHYKLNELDKFDLKKLDKYLWVTGREYFAKQYNNAKLKD